MTPPPPLPEGFADRAAWDAIHWTFTACEDGTSSMLDQAVLGWQLENQERCAAAAQARVRVRPEPVGTPGPWTPDVDIGRCLRYESDGSTAVCDCGPTEACPFSEDARIMRESTHRYGCTCPGGDACGGFGCATGSG